MLMTVTACLERSSQQNNLTSSIDTGDNVMPDASVKIYSLSTCSHCRSTKNLLKEKSVVFDAVDVDILEKDERKAVLKDIKKLNPKCSFPTIVIGEKVIVGYKEGEIKEALDTYGY